MAMLRANDPSSPLEGIVATNTNNAFEIPDIDCNDEIQTSAVNNMRIAQNIQTTFFRSISDENSAHDKEYKAHCANELIKIYCYSKYFTDVVAAAGQFIATAGQFPPTSPLQKMIDAYRSNDFKDLTKSEEDGSGGVDDLIQSGIQSGMHEVSNRLEDAAVESLGTIGKPLQITLKMFNKVATISAGINRAEKNELINERLTEWKRIEIPMLITRQAKKCKDVACAEKIISNTMSFFWNHDYLPKLITMAMHGESKWEEAAAFSGRGRLDKFASTPESFTLAMESGAIAVQIAKGIGWKKPGTGDPFETKETPKDTSKEDDSLNAFKEFHHLVSVADDWHKTYSLNSLQIHHFRSRSKYQAELSDTMNKMCEENDCFFDPEECCERCQKLPFCQSTFRSKWSGDVCDCMYNHLMGRRLIKENLYHYDRILEEKKKKNKDQEELQQSFPRKHRGGRRGGDFSQIKGLR